MTAEALVQALRARGLKVWLSPDSQQLRFRPAGQLTELERAQVAAVKQDLIAWIRAEGAATTLDDVLQVFPDARVVYPGRSRGLTCGRCGTSSWRPSGPGWVECAHCATDPSLPTITDPASDPYGPTPPTAPCRACRGTEYHRAGDGWTCSRCHPAPRHPAHADVPLSADRVALLALARDRGFLPVRLRPAEVVVDWPTFVVAATPDDLAAAAAALRDEAGLGADAGRGSPTAS